MLGVKSGNFYVLLGITGISGTKPYVQLRGSTCRVRLHHGCMCGHTTPHHTTCMPSTLNPKGDQTCPVRHVSRAATFRGTGIRLTAVSWRRWARAVSTCWLGPNYRYKVYCEMEFRGGGYMMYSTPPPPSPVSPCKTRCRPDPRKSKRLRRISQHSQCLISTTVCLHGKNFIYYMSCSTV